MLTKSLIIQIHLFQSGANLWVLQTMYKIAFQQCIKCALTVYRILDDLLLTRLAQET